MLYNAQSFRVARYSPGWRGRDAPPLPPKYEPVMGYRGWLDPLNREPPDGPNRIAVVGEGPGVDEDQAGVPFVGRTGQDLDRHLTTYNIVPDACYIGNVGRVYRIGDPDPTAGDIEMWSPILQAELNEVEPYWIIAVGRVSTRYFLGDVDMDTVHGIPYHIVLSWLANGRGGHVTVIPVVHPAAGFRSTEAQALTAYDFAQASLAIEGRLTSRDPNRADRYPSPVYRDLATLADWSTIAESLRGSGPVAIDTEGLPGSPWGLSYSTEPGTAYVIRATNTIAIKLLYTNLIQGIKGGRLHVVLHNSLHDLRVLRELGIPLPDGSYTDTMVLAYHLIIEPQGLKPLANRHAGMEMQSYDEIVQDAQDRIAVEYYELIEALVVGGVDCVEVLPDWADTDAIAIDPEYSDWVGQHTVEVPVSVGPFRYIHPYGITERDKTTGQMKSRMKKPQQIHTRVARALKELRSDRITPAQLRKRWADTDEMIVQIVEDVVGPMREADLNDVPLDRAIHYAARDADATIRIYSILAERHAAMGLTRVGGIDHSIIPMVDRMQAVGMPINRPYFEWLSVDLQGRMDRKQEEIYQRFGVRINPNSGEQVADLLFGTYGLIPTKKTKGKLDLTTGEMVGRRGSTQDKVLEGLRAAHPIIPMILDYRGLSKAKTSFVDVAIRKAVPDGKGGWVVHCNFRITRVSSGRLSATGPNLMAIMGGDLGAEIRKGYIAGEGYEYAEWDLSQIEMRVMASEANDAFLISMLANDEDIHTGTANKMFGFGLSRPHSKEQLAGIRLPSGVKPRDPAKRTGFGVITGIQPPGLVDQMRLQGIIVSEEEAAKWIMDWLAACPSVPEYMQACHREAMAFGYVRDWAGRIRYLPGIHSPFRHIRAEAGRQSHSHKIQGGAQEIMKIGMYTIWAEVLPYWWGIGKEIEPVLQIHDAVMLRRRGFSADEAAELDAQIRGALFAAAPPGFRVPLDAGHGHAANWGDLEH